MNLFRLLNPLLNSRTRISRSLGALLIAAPFACGAAAQQFALQAATPPAGNAAPAAAPSSANAEKESAGKLAAAGWLVLLDRRDWGRAWESASGVFRTAVPLGTWMDAIPKVRESMGTLVDRAPVESVYKTTLPGRPDGEYVTCIFQSKFDKRELQEIVTTVHDPDGRWRVTGYTTR